MIADLRIILQLSLIFLLHLKNEIVKSINFKDFTFAVFSESGELLPFTKAYSGLTDKEFLEINQWIKKNTLERFGPVRKVTAELVFEIAFEGIQESKRHKSGITLRFPRMVRWRKDKVSAEANTLEDLHLLLKKGK